MRKAYKVRLYPTPQQEQRLLRTIGACRFVWNHFLAERKAAYLERGESMNYHATAKALTLLKRQPELAWLDDIQTHPLQQSLRALEAAYKNFFEKRAAYPRFKSKKDSHQSFKKPVGWSIQGNRIVIERGLSVRFRGTEIPADNDYKTLTVSLDACGDWYASFTYEVKERPTESTGDPIGIDLGLTHLAVTNTGKKYDNFQPAKLLRKRMKRLQQKLARKQKGSKKRQAAKLAVARCHRKIAHQRLNHLHQTSHRITRARPKLIVCEDLAVKNMQANHSLAGSIADTAWGEFLRQLEYKQTWRGGAFVKIDRFFPSSKTCSACHFVVSSLPLSIRQWTCPKCGETHDRDVNAAKNILEQGLRNSLTPPRAQRVSRRLRARERVAGPVKREVLLGF